MTGIEKELLRSLGSIDKSLQSIAKSMSLMVNKPQTNVLTEQQLRSEGYDNISSRTD